MKLKKMGLTLGLASLALGGVAFVTSTGTTGAVKADAVDGEAADTVKVSIVIDGEVAKGFFETEGTPYIYYYGGDSTIGWDDSKPMEADPSRPNVWCYDVPAGATHYIVRDPGLTKQSVNIPVSPLWSDWTWCDDVLDPYLALGAAGQDGKYGIYATVDRQYTLTSDMVRYFVHRGDTASGKYFYVLIDGENETYYPASFAEAEIATDTQGTTWYAYFDLPYSEVLGKQYKLVSTDDAVCALWYETEVYTFEKGDNNVIHQRYWDETTKTQKIRDYNPLDSKRNLSHSFVGNYVLTSYYTCLDSDVNGFMAFPELKRNFIVTDDERWIVNGDLGSVEIKDYGYVPGTESYEDFYNGDKGEAITTNAWEKYSTMESLYEKATAPAAGAPTILGENGNDLTIAIASIVGAMLLGVGAYFFLRKKKEAPRA